MTTLIDLRRFLTALTLGLVGLGVWTLVIHGQGPSASIQANLSTTTCPGAGCVDLVVGGLTNVSIQLAGTFSGTVTFRASTDGTNFAALSMTPSAGGSAVTTATAAGIWNAGAGGYVKVRAVFTSYVSGTAATTITAAGTSPNLLSSNNTWTGTNTFDGDVTLDTFSATTGTITDLTVSSCTGCGGGGTPASPTTAIQFNDSGSFGGDAAFVYDSSSAVRAVGTAVGTALDPYQCTSTRPNAAATSMELDDTTGLPSAGVVRIADYNHAAANAETVSYTGKTATTITGMTRGIQGTTAIDWSARATCTVVLQTFAVYGGTTVPTLSVTNDDDNGSGNGKLCLNCSTSILNGFGYRLEIHDDFNADAAAMAIVTYNTGGPSYDALRANGTVDAPVVVANNDQLAGFQSLGLVDEGAGVLKFHHGTAMLSFVDGTMAPGDRPPGRFEFWVADTTDFPKYKMIFDSHGSLTVPTALKGFGVTACAAGQHASVTFAVDDAGNIAATKGSCS